MIRWLLPADPVIALTQVGLFAFGQRIATLVNRFVTVPFQSFWRPRRMELVVSQDPQIGPIVARVCTYSTLFTAQIALLLSVTVEDLLHGLVDRRYWEAHHVVPWIAASYVVLGLEHHFAIGMHYVKKTHWGALIGLFSLSILIVSNCLFVPRYGVLAASAATLVSLSIRSGLYLWVSQRLHPLPFELGRLSLMAAVCVVLFFAARQIDTGNIWGNLICRAACALCLLPILFGCGFFDRGEATIRVRHA
jgi:O-antigen/teichoic acid export membrane protein